VKDARSHTARNIAIAGGAAALVWLLLRGAGWRLGATSSAAGSDAATPTGSQPSCQVWIRSTGIELNGQPVDLPTLVRRCQATGRADVRATGAAIVGTIDHVMDALRRAGIVVYASADLWPHALGGSP
jgi:hypothetical protein